LARIQIGGSVSDFSQLSASERSDICNRVHRAVTAIGPASATAIMHRCGLPLATVIAALRAMETRGAVLSEYDRGSGVPEIWRVSRPEK